MEVPDQAVVEAILSDFMLLFCTGIYVTYQMLTKIRFVLILTMSIAKKVIKSNDISL